MTTDKTLGQAGIWDLAQEIHAVGIAKRRFFQLYAWYETKQITKEIVEDIARRVNSIHPDSTENLKISVLWYGNEAWFIRMDKLRENFREHG